ncbi:MAG TPA: hypothetical protein VFF73_32955 [Planctomycetota bacterium]|nr:hypothetical protein [Planctomycetota bacterium]
MRRSVLGALVVGAAVVSAPSARAEVKNLNGQTAPDLGKIEQAGGESVTSLGALKGKVVMLEFFATW